MAGHLYTFESSAIPDAAQVVAFKGTEGIQEIYSFEIGLVLKNDAEIDCAGAIGVRGKLKFDLGPDATAYVVQGTIGRIDLLHSWAEQTLYRVVLVPLAWTGTLNRRSFVHVEKKPDEVIDKLLGAWEGFEYEIRLNGSYPKYEHIVRYHESTMNFLSRWMEREGMYYFFEHGDSAEKLLVVDDKGSHVALRDKPVRYVPGSGRDHMALEAFDSWRKSHSRLVKQVVVEDYDELNPPLDILGVEQVSDAGLSQANFLGDNHKTADEAKNFAKRRAEERLAREVVFHGSGRVFNLRSGYKFTLEGHPRAEMNIDYLVTRLEHVGNHQSASTEVRRMLDIDSDDEYRVTVTAIPAETQYRAESLTPEPRVNGIERGWVDGPADSEYAQLDEHGRYRVKIFFDERRRSKSEKPSDGEFTFWVRMLQPHAGNPEGFHLPLRKKTEVALCFLGGNPDRPVICGSAPDAENPSPVTKDNHTLNVIQTGGKNRFEMQDEDGKQYVDISSPPKDTRLHLGEPHDKHSHYITLNTEGDCLFNVGGTRDIEIGGDQNEHVAGEVNENYDANQTTTIGADHTLDVGGSQTIDIGGSITETTGGDVNETYGGGQTTSVSAALSRTVGAGGTYKFGADGSYTYGATLTVKTGGVVTETFGGPLFTTVSGPHMFACSGPQNVSTGGPGTHIYGGPLTEIVGGPRVCIASGPIHFISPTVEVLTPTTDKTDGVFKWFSGFSNAVLGLSIGAAGIKIEGTGVYLGGTGLKIEFVGAQNIDGGLEKRSKGLYANMSGLISKLAALIKLG